MPMSSLEKRKATLGNKLTTVASHKRNPFKLMAYHFTLGTVILLVVIITVGFIIDPLQMYRKSKFEIFFNEPRYQNPGLALHYDYDTVILGSSMTENFRPSIVNAELGGETMKLSIRGSVAWEQHAIATLALETGKVSRVLWGIDYFALKDSEANSPEFPAYLYDQSLINDYKYLLNFDIYKDYGKAIYKHLKHPQHSADLDSLYNWDDMTTYGTDIVLSAYQKSRYEEYSYAVNEAPLSSVQHNFDEYMTSLVEQYPNVEFIFFYPPYSIIRQMLWSEANSERYHNQLAIKEWIYDRLATFSNVKIYDFQTESNWTYNLDLYKDLSHYSEQVNTWMTEAIADDSQKYRVTNSNVKAMNEQLIEQVNHTLIYHNGVKLVNITLQNEGHLENISAKDIYIPENEIVYVRATTLIKALDLTFSWDAESKTITISDEDIHLKLATDQQELVYDNVTYPLEHPATIINGSIHLPIVYVAPYLGLNVISEHSDEYSISYTLNRDDN